MNTRIMLIEDRWYRTHREAMALIEAERKAREEKTDRLRLMRIAKAALKPATTHRNKRHMKRKNPPPQAT